MPERIQRKRTRGWKMPPNTVYVGRPTQWGNPFSAAKPYQVAGGKFLLKSASEAASLFRQYVVGRLENGTGYPLAALRGKNLACWCPLDKPCHADVLLELANAPACHGTGKRDGGDR
jgi:hypothetical protein